MVRGTIGLTGMLAIALTSGLTGCAGPPVSLSQTPPTVRAAFILDHPGTTIRSINRQTTGGQACYAVRYADPDGSDHHVVFNGAGDEIDQH